MERCSSVYRGQLLLQQKASDDPAAASSSSWVLHHVDADPADVLYHCSARRRRDSVSSAATSLHLYYIVSPCWVAC